MPTPPSLGPQREPIGYAFSPDSLYFAVADSLGIDVYAWNTVSATLSYLTSITPSRSCPPNQSCMYFHSFAWDINDHLIALWGTYGDDGEIQVYTVTSSGIPPAPGSPHPLPAADFLTIVNAPTPRL